MNDQVPPAGLDAVKLVAKDGKGVGGNEAIGSGRDVVVVATQQLLLSIPAVRMQLQTDVMG